MPEKIAPSAVRYIKLGPKNQWAPAAFERGELHFGYKTISHELCAAGQWDQVTQILIAEGRSGGKETDATREIRDFYTLDQTCLWITFADRRLYWAFAEPEVIWAGPETEAQGCRVRKTIGPWRSSDTAGRPLLFEELSTRLTQVASYRQTLCSVRDQDYLLRRVNGEAEPIVQEAIEVRGKMLSVAARMIKRLHWAEFETMVDLIFTRSGWQRVSTVGGTQKDADLILQHPTTGETASVQVKSKARQAVLDDYVKRFRSSGMHDRLFFICHSPIGALSVSSDRELHLWTDEVLAATAIRAGLFEWLIERCD